MVLKNLKFITLLLSCIYLGYGCASETSGGIHRPEKFNAFEKVQVDKDTAQSYTLYVPTRYDKSKAWPVILLFDPHRDGQLAVENFKEAAETFGYILAGSNQAGNGVANTREIAENLLEDVLHKFNIDKRRIYTGGFSGGARIALSTALTTGKVKGVITCSAGVASFEPSFVRSKIDVYGLAGLEDFNYKEVAEIPVNLQNSGWRNAVELFDGAHAWPPKASIFNSVLWHELQAMRDGVIEKDKTFLRQLSDSLSAAINGSLAANRFLMAERQAALSVSFLQGLTDVSGINNMLEKIREMPAYKQELEKDAQVRYQERELQQAYTENFTMKDTAWWRNEVNALHNEIAGNKDLLYHQMYSRIKGFLGILAYSFVSRAVANDELVNSGRYIALYEIIEPRNADCFFYKAVWLERMGKWDEAVAALRKSLALGLTDVPKIKGSLSQKVWKGAGVH